MTSGTALDRSSAQFNCIRLICLDHLMQSSLTNLCILQHAFINITQP